MNLNKLRSIVTSSIAKVLPKKKDPLEEVVDQLYKFAAAGHSNPELFKTVRDLIIRYKGLRGYQRSCFRKSWAAEYSWKDTRYLIDAAEVLSENLK